VTNADATAFGRLAGQDPEPAQSRIDTFRGRNRPHGGNRRSDRSRRRRRRGPHSPLSSGRACRPWASRPSLPALSASAARVPACSAGVPARTPPGISDPSGTAVTATDAQSVQPAAPDPGPVVGWPRCGARTLSGCPLHSGRDDLGGMKSDSAERREASRFSGWASAGCR